MSGPASPARPPSRALPFALLLIAAASWGGNWVAARAVIGEFPPFALVFWRWVLAVVLLLALAAPHLRGDWMALRRQWKYVVLMGIIGTAGFSMFGFWGLRHTTATNAVLLTAAMPLYQVPLSWLLLGLAISLRQSAGVALAFLGVVVIVSRGDLSTLATLRFNAGDLLVMIGLFLWALYTVFLPRGPKVHPLSFLCASAIAGLAFTTPFYLGELAAGAQTEPTAKNIGAIVYLAVFPSVVSYVCWSVAVRSVGPNMASFFNPTVPMFGVLWAILLLGEQPALYHGIGFGLAIAGLFLTTRR